MCQEVTGRWELHPLCNDVNRTGWKPAGQTWYDFSVALPANAILIALRDAADGAEITKTLIKLATTDSLKESQF
jgi:hypothetical protein